MKHRNSGHYGVSAIMCTPLVYATNACQFILVQRIFNYCAHAKLNVSISGNSAEEVIVAIPIHLHYSLLGGPPRTESGISKDSKS